MLDGIDTQTGKQKDHFFGSNPAKPGGWS